MPQNNNILSSTSLGIGSNINTTTINSSTINTNSYVLQSSTSANKVKFNDGTKWVDLTDLLQDLNKKARQFDCLTKILIQKGILAEEEINDMLASFDVMDKISEE